jgi:hypothetical protein
MDKKEKPTMVPVSERALVQRINRKLWKESEVLKAARPNTRAVQDLGRYYVIDDRNRVVRQHCDLEEMGRELGVLAAYERLVQ